MRGLFILVFLLGCHDVGSIPRYDSGLNDVPAFDGGPGFGPDARLSDVGSSDSGPPFDSGAVDGGGAVVDAGPPPPSPISVVFENTFMVRGVVRLGEGTLVVGVDNQNDRDPVPPTGDGSRQALALFIHDSNQTLDWAHNYGGPVNNDQFLTVIKRGADALVIGTRGLRERNLSSSHDSIRMESSRRGPSSSQTRLSPTRYS